MTNLGRKTITGIYWAGGTKIVSQSFSWVCTLLVARILSPNDYGIMAIATMFTELIGYLAEFGAGAALVQKKDLTREETDGIFWLILFNSIILASLLAVSAPWIANFYNTPGVHRVLQAIAFSMVLSSIRSVQRALVVKELKFEARARADLAVDIIGMLALLVSALAGFGVWSLVISLYARGVSAAILFDRIIAYKPGMAFSFRTAAPLMRFGLRILGANLSYLFYSMSDNAVVGKLLGPKTLGHYSMAMQLACVPIEKVVGILNSVQYASYSKLQDDIAQLRKYFLAFTRVFAAICYPMLAGLIVVADDFITAVLTEKWQAVVLPMRILAIVSFFKMFSSIVSPLLNARGKPQLVMRYHFFTLCTLPPGFLIGAKMGGLVGVTIAWLIVYTPMALYAVYLGIKETGVSVADYFNNLLPVLISSALMVLALVFWNRVSAGFFGAWGRLVTEIILGVCIYIAALFTFFPSSRKDLRYVMGKAEA